MLGKFPQLFCLQRRHVGYTHFGTFEFANSIRPLRRTTLYVSTNPSTPHKAYTAQHNRCILRQACVVALASPSRDSMHDIYGVIRSDPRFAHPRRLWHNSVGIAKTAVTALSRCDGTPRGLLGVLAARKEGPRCSVDAKSDRCCVRHVVGSLGLSSCCSCPASPAVGMTMRTRPTGDPRRARRGGRGLWEPR